MDNQRSPRSGFSSIAITAALAVVVLIAAMIRQSYVHTQDQNMKLQFVKQKPSPKNPSYDDFYKEQLSALVGESSSAATSAPRRIGPTVLDQIAESYTALKESGTYTPATARQVGAMMAPMIHSELAFKSYTERDFETTHDSSASASLEYQNALHEALAPLRENTTPEFELYGNYIATKNPVYLEQLRRVATLYQEAAEGVVRITTPIDAISYSIAIANALSQFGSALTALAERSDDPIGSVVMLGSYNSAEQSVLNAFTALNLYYANKH